MNPTTLIAYEMNGAPARMLVPSYFGEKNVKWVARIEVALDSANDGQNWPEAKIDYYSGAMIGSRIVPAITSSRSARPTAKDRFRRKTKSAQKLR